MNKKDIQERLAAILDEMNDLLEAGLDESSRVEYDALEQEAETLRSDLDRIEKQEARKAWANKPATTNKPSIVMGDAPADKGFSGLGEFLCAVRSAGSSGGSRDERLIPEQRVSGASEGIPSDGGFLVGTDIANDLMRNAFDQSDLLSRCRRIPISSNSNSLTVNVIDETTRVAGSRWGGIQIYRKPEGVAATAKKVKYAQLNFKLKKLIGLSYSTDELEADAAAHAAIISQAFAEEFSFVIDDEIFRGDGASQMLGFTAAPCFVSVAKETGQAPDTLVYENILKMYSRLAGSGVWLTNRDCFPQLATMSLPVGTGGMPVYLPPNGAADAPYGTLLGLPLIFTEQSPTVGDANDIVLVDLSQYAVIEKGGLQAAVSMHVKFIEDEMAYRWTLRNDGQPLWKSSVTPYKGSATRSPFIGLAERA
jgi:HK97 family phage major capsid protein